VENALRPFGLGKKKGIFIGDVKTGPRSAPFHRLPVKGHLSKSRGMRYGIGHAPSLISKKKPPQSGDCGGFENNGGDYLP
jgi:hypothetical protein